MAACEPNLGSDTAENYQLFGGSGQMDDMFLSPGHCGTLWVPGKGAELCGKVQSRAALSQS